MQQRPISDEERELLGQYLGGDEAELRRAMLLGYLITWVASAGVLIVLWQMVAWLVRVALGAEFGWDYSGADFIVGAIVLTTGVTTGMHGVRGLRARAQHAPAAAQDRQTGHVIEESLEIIAAKRFQEQEHGGLIYFFKTNDDRIYVIYDTESQDLGVDGKNPLDSSFRPMSQLTIARTPAAEIVVSTTFSGIELPLPEVGDLLIDPLEWPDPDAFCDIPWDELETRLAG